MSALDIVVPRVNANDETVEVLKWFAGDGEFVEAGRPVLDLGTTKAAVSVESPAGGFLVRLCVEGDIVPVGGLLARLVSTTDEIADARHRVEPASISTTHGPARLSRAARQHLAAAGGDPGATGLTGLVTTRRLRPVDAQSHRQPLDRIKRAEVQALLNASDVLASSVSVEMAGMAGSGSGRLPRIIYEVARLLATYPALNGYFADGAIESRDAIDLGVALDLGRGLRVVTMLGTNARTTEDIDRQLYDFTERYLSDTLRPDDMSPASFTITDLSSLGASAFQPLIGERQAAILGVSGGAEAGTPLVLTLVFDHRVSNGRTAAMFLSDLRDLLTLESSTDAAATPSAAPPMLVETRRCDRCNIMLEDYYGRYPRDAFMHVWMRPDGSLGLMCHICASGLF